MRTTPKAVDRVNPAIAMDRATPEGSACWRFVEAVEEMRAAAKALGLDPDRLGEIHAPIALRVDAFLWRSSRLLAAPRRNRERKSSRRAGA